LRANSGLTPAEYSLPVLGLVFLAYADHRFAEAENEQCSEAIQLTGDAVASAHGDT
jgi:type I restriction enzyme M protein